MKGLSLELKDAFYCKGCKALWNLDETMDCALQFPQIFKIKKDGKKFSSGFNMQVIPAGPCFKPLTNEEFEEIKNSLKTRKR